jgi:hypothetical protein
LQHKGMLGKNNRAYALKSLVGRGRMPDLRVGLHNLSKYSNFGTLRPPEIQYQVGNTHQS